MYAIKFGDGTKLENLGLNGNNFISQEELTEEFFTPEKLAHVEITSDGESDSEYGDIMCGEFENMRLMTLRHYQNVRSLEDGYYFALTA